MRQLASVQKVLALRAIPEADSIECATVLGWELVVKKGEFAVGDLCVYCEIDSILPDRPEYEFLRSKKMRVKTMRMRGQISQGICFKLSVLPADFSIVEGADCTEALGVKKYDPEVDVSPEDTEVKRNFPEFLRKTDETRVQVLQGVLNTHAGIKCYVTEKLDGSSITFYLRNGTFGVCSRNLELYNTSELSKDGRKYWEAALALGIEERMRKFGKNIALQGELIGTGIQKNKYNLSTHEVHFFSVYDIDTEEYYNYAEFLAAITAMGLTHVPILTNDYALEATVSDIVKFATRKSVLEPKVWAEGVVIRPLIQQQYFKSLKAINPEFLLKYDA